MTTRVLSYQVPPEMWAFMEAEFLRRGSAALNECTQMKDREETTIYGVAGEVGFGLLMLDFQSAGPLKPNGYDPDCDFISPGGVKVDIKSRGRTKYPSVEDPTWKVRVPEYSYRAQNCHAYAFAHVQFIGDNVEWVHFVGWLRKEEVPLRGVRVEPGSAVEQPSGYNGNLSDRVQYEIPMPSLNPMSTFRGFCRAP